MKIVMCHEYYQRRGGEDEVFDLEASLLSRMGHEVIIVTEHNDTIKQHSLIRTGVLSIWNHGQYRHFKNLVLEEKPDIVHFYNTFPLVSPAAIHGAKAGGATVVQSLHNYRLMCINASLFRAMGPCETCIGRALPLAGTVHGCYHDSRVQSAAVMAISATHRMASTWTKKVDLFLLGSTEFAVPRFEAQGIAKEKIVLKPNFVYPDPGVGDASGKYALFVGRFDPEKGISDLLDAWRKHESSRKLVIVGDGPLSEEVARAADRYSNIEWLGRLSLDDLYQTLKRAAFLIFPSRWYEAMPRIILDSFAVGTPVLSSRIGVMQHLVTEDVNGGFFEPGDIDSLHKQSGQMFLKLTNSQDMRVAARQQFENNYTAERNYEAILSAYRRALRITA